MLVIELGSLSCGVRCSAAPSHHTSYHPSATVVIEFGSKSAAQSFIHRKTVVIVGSESAAHWQSILHRNPVVIEFGSPVYHPSSLSSIVIRRPRPIIHPIIHLKKVVIEVGSESDSDRGVHCPVISSSKDDPVHIEFGLPAQPASMIHNISSC